MRWAESVARKNHSGIVMIESKKRTLNKVEAAGAEYEQKKSSLVLNDDNDLSRRVVEQCFRTDRTILNPIVDWTDDEVWEFLHHYGCESNPLYHCGSHRIGCIGCPMAGGKRQKEEFERYPIYRANYIRAFNQMLEKRKADGKETNTAWTDGEAVMAWWVGDLKADKERNG